MTCQFFNNFSLGTEMRSLTATASLFCLCVTLTGCGGGGGSGSGGGSAAITPFTQWSQIAPNSTVQANGGYTYVSAYQAKQSYTGASVVATFDVNQNLTAIAMATPLSSASYSIAAGDGFYSPINNNVTVAYNKAGTSAALFVNPAFEGWQYQTFGVWGSTGSFATSANSNAVSVGTASPASGVPTTGTANFSGVAAGVYQSVTGASFITGATMNASVNFGSRTIGFATTGTNALPVYGTTGLISAPGLNMVGQLSYGSGTGNFSGPVVAANGMTGAIAGQFYGPNANEIGGTYGLGNANVGAMIGGFGGKR